MENPTDTDFDTVPASFLPSSPSGGPSGNANAIVLISMRKSKKLKWKAGNVVTTVDLIHPTITDDTQTGGPTPLGEFLIGERYEHATHKIDWYKLYPRMKDNTGYFGYGAATETGRATMGLHPGGNSAGCVTIDSDGATPHDTNTEWIALQKFVDSGSMTYNGTGFTGFLYVIDK